MGLGGVMIITYQGSIMLSKRLTNKLLHVDIGPYVLVPQCSRDASGYPLLSGHLSRARVRFVARSAPSLPKVS